MGRTVIVQPGQTLEDIALQEYGSVDGVTWLLLDNEELLPDGYSTALPAGEELAIRDGHADADVHGAMRRLGVVPASVVQGEFVEPLGGSDHNEDYNEDYG